MIDDQLVGTLDGTCECGEKGIIGEVCDICGGVFSEGNSSFDDLSDDDEDLDAYPKDLLKKEASHEDIVPLEEIDKDEEDESFE